MVKSKGTFQGRQQTRGDDKDRSCLQHFIFQLTHTTLKNVELLKYFKKGKLLQHVSVYKETIIREPQPVLS